MKKIQIELYNYSELSKEARKNAHDAWNRNDDMPFLSEEMKEQARELIEEAGMKIEDMKVYYSLSYSQGDGAMIEGFFTWKGNEYRVKNSGYHCHERSTTIECVTEDEDGNAQGDENAFEEEMYVPVCKKLARFGYDCIEAEREEQTFIDACEDNGYTFEANGTMRNA